MAESEAKQSLKTRAYAEIKARILDCTYAPGEFLNEQQLCTALGDISRTPVRDALSRLEQEGLVTILPKKGTVVSSVTVADVSHIYEVRMLIEPYALRQYGAAIPHAQLEHFAAVMQDLPRAQRDISYFNTQDDAFHAMIVNALPNHYLQATYYNISDLNMRFRVLSGRRGLSRVEATYAEHRAVLDACFAGDWGSASSLLVHHLELGRAAAFEGLAAQDGIQL